MSAVFTGESAIADLCQRPTLDTPNFNERNESYQLTTASTDNTSDTLHIHVYINMFLF